MKEKITYLQIAEGIGTRTPKQLAKEYGVSVSTIYNKLARLGMCTKQEGQKGGSK